MGPRRPDLLLRACADRTRLRILALLTRGELCVCDIQAALAAPQSKVSRHLATLRRAGLVADRRRGRWKHYSLAKPEGEFHRRLAACLAACRDDAGAVRREACR